MPVDHRQLPWYCLDVPRPVCEEQLRLAQMVVKAGQAVADAKTKQDEAAKEKRDSVLLVVALREARKTERVAVYALDEHLKEHKC
jgi:hypothetical protein